MVENEALAFLKRCEPTFAGQRFELPVRQCASCKLRNRSLHRNEWNLYKNTSARSGTSLVSIYHPDEKLPIYSTEEWWSESWDALEYGRDYDFSRSFFEQFTELSRTVPRLNLIQVSNENCSYTTGTAYCKNSYLINCSEYSEDCYYGKLLQSCTDVVDSSFAYNSELCYECFNVRKCYNCVYVSYSENSRDCWFSENLSNCSNCFLCTNLVGKQYYFMNKPLPKEQYEKMVETVRSSYTHFAEAISRWKAVRSQRIHKYANVINCENTTGDFLSNCKNCFDSYDMNDSEDCRNVTVGVEVKDLLDCSNMYLKSEVCYEVLSTIAAYNCFFCLRVYHSQNLYYSELCYNSKNLFGCFGLRNKEYCIFNKQYTKEQYEEMVARIINDMRERGEWGVHFPPSHSPLAYNESLAQEYFPLTREQAQEAGFRWREVQASPYLPTLQQLPDSTAGTPPTLLSEICACASCGKGYRIIEQELAFLKRQRLPLPRRCPDCRYKERLALRNPRELFDRLCGNCGVAIRSPFAENRPEVIYCETCYQRERA
ncbi:hypothetical protein CO046_02140 [Candidatus Peregrinibacteria bacterium CG_4_9_14_0_2_um_filter_53_11]|nr:MAG: hypothetical protein CO046_02140 [Candidatus Peregrinibacteria bacterium CG_4_9_14_0_2_um_filter_53_11]